MGRENWDHVRYPIDIVYLWVDGSDPAWLKKKNEALQAEKGEVHTYSLEDKRFTDHQELRYSLRSLIRYAPFFNHIYIVTMGQRPNWLMDHPRVTIIDHKQIFKNPSDLPTFTSRAIESNIHRIPHLSEHFIYFNDDFFLGAPVTPFDFFTKEGEVVVLFSKIRLPQKKKSDHPMTVTLATLDSFLNTFYKKEPHYELCHSPYALRKSYLQDTENTYPQIFQQTSSQHFRNVKTYPITFGFAQYHWLYQKKVVSKPVRNKYVPLTNSPLRNTFSIYLLRFTKPHTFCLQDLSSRKSARIDSALRSSLTKLYPEPAPWETPL